MTLNHYYMDTYNKIRTDEFQKHLDEYLAELSWSSSVSPGEVKRLVKDTCKSWFAEYSGTGESNERQVHPNIVHACCVSLRVCSLCRQGIYINTEGGRQMMHEDMSRTHELMLQEAVQMTMLLRAYWKTSAKRFIDKACQVIDRYKHFMYVRIGVIG
jgi:hypothetical protein